MGMEKLAISKLVRDAGTQVRAKLDDDRVKDYAEILDELPPVKVVYDGTRYILWDGFHTTKAHEDKGRKDITCEVRPGTLRDAILLSLGANSDHGLPRTRDDKRRAILRMLQDEEWAQWLPSAIAKHCRVTRYLIDEVAKEHGIQLANSPVERSKGADGKTRNTEKVKESNRKRAEEKRAKAKPEVERPPTAEKPKPSGQKVDQRDRQDEYPDEGEDRHIETAASAETGAETVDRIAGDFAKGERASDAEIDGKPAPEVPEWEKEAARDREAEADIKKLDGAIIAFREKHPRHLSRLAQFLTGQARIATIKAEEQSP